MCSILLMPLNIISRGYNVVLLLSRCCCCSCCFCRCCHSPTSISPFHWVNNPIHEWITRHVLFIELITRCESCIELITFCAHVELFSVECIKIYGRVEVTFRQFGATPSTRQLPWLRIFLVWAALCQNSQTACSKCTTILSALHYLLQDGSLDGHFFDLGCHS